MFSAVALIAANCINLLEFGSSVQSSLKATTLGPAFVAPLHHLCGHRISPGPSAPLRWGRVRSCPGGGDRERWGDKGSGGDRRGDKGTWGRE